jgi:hypothetical protein
LANFGAKPAGISRAGRNQVQDHVCLAMRSYVEDTID